MWRDRSGKKRRGSLKTRAFEVAEADLAAELDAETRPTFGSYAKEILEDGDEYLWQRGLSEQTIYAKKRCIKLLTDQFGSDLPGATRESDIEKWLRNGPYSASYQGEIMDAYTFVMR